MANVPEQADQSGGRTQSSRDREIECVECGKSFTFTAKEQKFYKEKGFESQPRRCSTCRSQRKKKRKEKMKEKKESLKRRLKKFPRKQKKKKRVQAKKAKVSLTKLQVNLRG